MKRRICRECDNEMVRKYADGDVKIFCETCNDETEHDHVDMDPYCPVCKGKITVCTKCCEGYFCETCKSLVASKKIVWKQIEQDSSVPT